MKRELEDIVENAKAIIELAECDIDCFADDFYADDYRKYMGKIEEDLKAAETEHNAVMEKVKGMAKK